jgi:hypothetical protein
MVVGDDKRRVARFSELALHHFHDIMSIGAEILLFNSVAQ